LNHVGYIFRNPVGRNLVEHASEYPYCSAYPRATKDEAPQWLKPSPQAADDTPEGASLQNLDRELVAKD
jgi:hypothetical protein